MEYNFFVTLFKDKTKKRIIKKFVTYTKAKSFFTKLKNNSDNVIFSKEVENGKDCKFELGLIELSSKQLFPIYMTDEMGRNIKVKLEDDNMTLVEITPYKIEELLYDIQTGDKIDTNTLIKKYIKGDGVKMISTLHNKIIIQQALETANPVLAQVIVPALQVESTSEQRGNLVRFLQRFTASRNISTDIFPASFLILKSLLIL